MNMKLINNWKKAHKMSSVHIAIAVAVLGVLQASWPEFREVVGTGVYASVNALLGVGVVVARIVSQSSLEDKEPPENG